MSKDVRISREELRKASQAEYEKLLQGIEQSVNQAPDGAVIAGSEEAVRDAMARFRERVYEIAIQLRADKAAKAAFSPQRSSSSGRLPQDKGLQGINHLTGNGTIRIRRRIYWHPGEGRDDRLDRWLGIDEASVSPAARELCCRVASAGVSFRKAAENLQRLGQIQASVERLRQISEVEGRRVLRARQAGQLGPNWTVADCRTVPEGPTRIMAGSDGVLVPLVTEQEKQKRRQKVRARPDRGRGKRRRRRVRGADQGYKEFKIATFYDQTRTHQYAVGTAGDHEVLGRLMAREAEKLKFDEAQERVSVTDGAEWIRRQIDRRLWPLDAMILDYYHLAEHVGQAAKACWGEGTEQAQAWRRQMLGALLEEGASRFLVLLEQTRRPLRAGRKRQVLSQLEQYVTKRAAMVDYPSFRRRGFDIGSGPTEAFCRTLTGRLKGSGMRWDAPNAEAMMALASLEHSNLWEHYWNRQKPAAA